MVRVPTIKEDPLLGKGKHYLLVEMHHNYDDIWNITHMVQNLIYIILKLQE